ncbi:Outer membrane autotransporter barrel domain protein [Candidatus Hamiltonella defensa (Bemisia tabaci)]|uniref:Uncharacterized protein n=3 Tax=Candidatus Williamhamiltonella defendens TaxID=138072 RepID=A0A249E0M3_9ENTR|nr:hypothetical protein BA171_05890 [Candidatus Hamiltonella defensa (Bemisia tabaci)]CED78412.1 Outer membrane autotransporter barrel domain protein [Candidatus Hamiltonella defensa (Bemisia tabaci)]
MILIHNNYIYHKQLIKNNMMKKFNFLVLASFVKKIGKLSLLSTLISCGGGGGGGSGGTYAPPIGSKPTPSVPVNPGKQPEIWERIFVENYLDQTKIKKVHQQGHKGQGVNILVLDGGDIPDVPELDKKKINEITPPTTVENQKFEHGASVVSMIVGNKTGNFAGGVAPESHVFYVDDDNVNTKKRISLEELEELVLNNNIKIINHSYTLDNSAYGLGIIAKKQLIAYLEKSVNDLQVLHIWAAGNDFIKRNPYTGGLPYLLPQLERSWITVVGVYPDGDIDDGSVKCYRAKNFCIGAPMQLWMRGEMYRGTSYSAPIVSGIAALVSGKYPWMTANNLRQVILTSGSNAHKKELSDDTGWGVVDAEKAINGPSLFDKRLTNLEGVTDEEKYSFVADVTNQAGQSYFFSNNIDGDAGLIKKGEGELILTGENSYTGDTHVKKGRLSLLGGVLNSNVMIDKEASFKIANGIVNADITNNGWLLTRKKFSPNSTSSLDTSIVDGKLTLNENSTLISENGSELFVSKNIFLNNPKLNVLVGEKEIALNNYIALLSKEILNGRFSSIKGVDERNQPIKTHDFTIEYGSDGQTVIILVKDKEGIGYEARRAKREILGNDDETYNAVAQSLTSSLNKAPDRQKMAQARPEIQRLLTTSDPKTLGNMLDSLSGQLYASGLALSFQQSAMINRVLGNRLNQITQNSASSGMWFDLYGGKGELKQTGFATGKTDFWGGQWGADTRINDNWVIGGAVLAGRGQASFDRWGGQSISRNIGVSVYSRYGQNRGWYTAGRLGGASIDNETERKILTNDEKMIGAKHKDNLWSGYLETGYVMHRNQSRITPFVGLAYDRITRGAFAEKGDESAFALKANAASYDQTSGLLGVRFAHRFDWAAGSSWVQAYGLYQRSLKADDLSYKATFVGFPSVHHWVKGIDLPKHSGWVGIGLNTQSTPVFSWQAGYNAQMGGYGKINHLLNLGFRINFI